QKGVWQTTLLLFLVLLGFLALAVYVFLRVLRPIGILAMKSRQLVPAALRVTTELPYGERGDEIGTLSTAFSDLLRETRERAEEARRKQAEDVRNRELNLKTIGHEIRSPLQALLGLHPPGDPGRHYIDRMVRAVKYLFSGTGPQSSFDSIPLVPEQLDVASFLVQLAANAPLAGIPDVHYEGPAAGVVCFVDPDALEDAVSHLLSNANRHRRAGTAIRLTVLGAPAEVCITVFNEGENIPEEIVERIFDLHFSHTATRDESNQGLGLFVTRNYISRMSGSVAARNHVNGVSFEVRLPVSRL
ncbi:MAG: HAMP domain-containing histidine kinase, partial [Gammaproteobacteria bacterium]|nr:HAMP domain-containing histidine kinase [Gammaproteobacteria bacterium]